PLKPASVQVLTAIVALVAVVVPLVAAMLMARASLRSGRADRRGAARLGVAVAAFELAGTWLVMAHSPGSSEVVLLMRALVLPLVLGVVAWVLYIALEPSVRRTWPSSLISWNRIVDGRFRDARVARDVLIGLAATAVLDGLDPLVAVFTPMPPRGSS